MLAKTTRSALLVIFITSLERMYVEAQNLSFWELDTPIYRLIFFDEHASDWNAAVAKCAGISENATLVQLNDNEVKNAVIGNISSANDDFFWIGATRTCGTCDTWEWVDGKAVNLSEIEWFDGNPDNAGGKENKMIIRTSDSKFVDIHEDFPYAGTICQEVKYCNFNDYAATCRNEGKCSSTPNTFPYYKCECNDTGYYGQNCTVQYCDFPVHNETCKNGGVCYSTPNVFPYYNCSCRGTGFFGNSCERELLILESDTEVIGIVGAYAKIDIEVKTKDGNVTIAAFKNITSQHPLQTKTDVGNGTTTFRFKVNSLANEGLYTFVAYPASKEYERNTSTNLVVHVNATVEDISQSFIFSPITDGSSEVKCVVSGIPQPSVIWYRSNGSAVINSSSENGIYQTINSDAASLHVESAFLFDNGNYTCITKNTVGENSTNVSDKNIIQLAVYGRPTIETVYVKECSPRGNLLIEWSPNIQTTKVLHRFVVEAVNTTNTESITKFATIDEGNIVVFVDLMPWTQYKVLVEVCPDQCIKDLNRTDVKTTGHGLPGQVNNSTVELLNENMCVVDWSWPDTPRDQITEYTVIVEEKFVYEPEGEATNKKNHISILAPDSSYTHKTEPNRDYTFFITALTCAGPGEPVTASGKCRTKSSNPAEVPQAVIKTPVEPGSTRQITIPLADETYGPISCTFVIVNRGNNVNTSRSFGIEELQDTANVALSGENGDYLAIAIPRENISDNQLDANLGDNTGSECDISKTFNSSSRNRRNVGVAGTMFKGRNWPLRTDGTAYAVYLVTTTPVSGEDSLVTVSLLISFTNGSSYTAGWIIGIVIGIAAAIIVVFIVIFVMRRKGLGMFARNETKTSENPANALKEVDVYDCASGYDSVMNSNSNDGESKKDSSDALYEIIPVHAYENIILDTGNE